MGEPARQKTERSLFMQSRFRVAIVCGTRPEIVKLAPVYRALRQHGASHVDWIHTGQHSDMAEAMLECFGIEPSVRLRRQGSSLEEFSASCRGQLDALLQQKAYDFCVVQGDTESAFLGALCAFYRRIPVGHVEAGLRTHNLARPFPEEGLRQMISRIADVHFAPTRRAVLSLLAEGIPGEKVELTGNTVVDAQNWAMRQHRIETPASVRASVLVTVHRRENWGSDMEEIFRGIAGIAAEHPEYDVLFPVHLNPVVSDAAHRLLGGIGNVKLLAPFDYLQTQRALARASLVLTDSGGLQEEAPTHQVPVIVLRHETERPEAVEAGFATLVGPHAGRMRASARALLADKGMRERLKGKPNPYGDGRASRRIAASIARRFEPDATDLPALPAYASGPLPPHVHDALGA
jgi:UDP-N-acetylglucosamine 2-epimerase (non-hydrolysing)